MRMLLWILLILVFLIMLHHLWIHGYLVDIQDIDNHETIALFLLGIAIGIWLTLNRRKLKQILT